MSLMRSDRALSWTLRWLPFLLIGALTLLFAALAPQFVAFANVGAILNQASWLIIAALGANLVLLVGGVDLSTGTAMYLAAVVASSFVSSFPPLLVLISAAIVGLVFGMVNGILTVAFGVPAFIVTLATAFIGRGIALYLSSTQMVFASDTIAALGRDKSIVSPSFLVASAAVLLSWALLRNTPFGKYVYAAGADAAGARRAGVPIRRVIPAAYGISGLLAGVAGFVSLSQTSAASASFGQNAEFLAIAAAVLGGTSLFGGRGTFWAPLVGALLIVSLQNGLTMINANPYAYPVITGAVIFLAALVDGLRARALARLERRRRS